MGSSSPALSNMQFLFSYPPLPWLLPAPSLRRAWRPLRLFPMSTTPPAMSLSTIPLQLFPTSMMPPVMLPTLLPLKPRLTSMTPQVMSQCPTSTRSPLLPPLLPHLLSLTLPTLTPTVPTPTCTLVPTSSPTRPTPTTATLDTPMPLLPTTPAVSTTLAALCPAHKCLASKLKPKDRRRTAKDRGRLENENWILEDVV